jgi:hypothetical protein
METLAQTTTLSGGREEGRADGGVMTGVPPRHLCVMIGASSVGG